MSKKDYSYNRFGSVGQRVGQAAYDILSKPQPSYSAEEIFEGMSHSFVEELEKCIKDGEKKYGNKKFYVFVLTNKALTQFGVTNVVRNFFIHRLSAPLSSHMMKEFPHFVKTLYEIDCAKGDLEFKWSIPGIEDCRSILKNTKLYSQELIKSIRQALEGLVVAA